jgi:hypothetical protein
MRTAANRRRPSRFALGDDSGMRRASRVVWMLWNGSCVPVPRPRAGDFREFAENLPDFAIGPRPHWRS